MTFDLQCFRTSELHLLPLFLALDSWSSHHKGVANGLYISFYYTGGSLGSYLPGWVYTNFGWSCYIFCLALVVFTALILAWDMSGKMKDLSSIEVL